jgi:hypothetical protein
MPWLILVCREAALRVKREGSMMRADASARKLVGSGGVAFFESIER